ncbi:DUF6186 family protein [Paramicrobacterium fandaimingii]|uniref:DUF6186 family protein n=1 Tax=Paramicrobacterium fandaimingii TaxID=2708079 RepID=UPI0014200803|nr:DUF6186 family protein [Microbacterium fandaimingii]
MMHTVTIGVYTLCLVAACGLVAWSHRDPVAMSSPSQLLDDLFTSHAARIAIIVFWWWIGWHFLFAQTLDG